MSVRRMAVISSGQAGEEKEVREQSITGALQLAFGCRRLEFAGGAKG